MIHDLLHGRSAHDRVHIRGYQEEGSTTTPFDMVVLNGITRLQRCVPGALTANAALVETCNRLLREHEAYTREHFDDLPEIKNWTWTE